MHSLNRSICYVATLLLVLPAGAYANSWSCTKNDHTREVVIEYTGDGTVPCNVVYKKPTEKVEDQTLWSATNAEGYCEEKAGAFVGKLESWGWACSKSEAASAPEDSPAMEETKGGEAEGAE